MASVEPIIVVLGPRCGGTSAVAGVLHHLGVFMGAETFWTNREPHETWEERHLSLLCGHAFRAPGDRLAMDPDFFAAKLRGWADDHRRAARSAGRRPGAKDPLLCLAVDFLRDAWAPTVPVVVERPFEHVVASLNRLGWFRDERERVSATQRLIAARDQALVGAAVVRVDFEELRTTPVPVIRRLADQLGLEVTEAQVQAATDSVVQPADVRQAARSADPYGIKLLLAKVQRNPEDWWAVNLLAQAYFDSGDFGSARKWYARQIEMGAPDEDIFLAKWQLAVSMGQLGLPWREVQDAYLQAWEFRPARAEPLYAIAQRYRMDRRYQLGYLFAQRAARIPLPEDDLLRARLDSYRIYAWSATEEQALCALRIGKQAEGFTLCRHMLARPDLPDDDRRRIANNRDVAVPTMIQLASTYPDALVGGLVGGPRDVEVTVSLVAGPDRDSTEQTLNSFLRCCTDVSRVGRFLVVDAGLSVQDRATLTERYGFLEFADCGERLAQLRDQVGGPFWLHLGQAWQFFAPENYITRLTAVLEAETQLFQVGINLGDAIKLTHTSAPEHAVRRTSDAGRYVLADAVASGPAMFDTARLNRAGGLDDTDPDPIAALGRRAAAAGLRTASLDEVLCISA